MDDFSFDDLTRSLAMPSRRTLLFAFTSVFTGLVATNKDALARAKRRDGKSRAKHQGKAKGKDHGRRKGKDHGKHKDKNQGKRKVKDEGRPKGKSKAKLPQSQQLPAAGRF